MKRAKGNGEYAKVTITLEPGARDSGIVFENKIKGGAIPTEFIPAVEKGIRNAATCGPIDGWPVSDFKAILTDGKYHDQDSSAYAFEIAAHRATRDGFELAEPRLLEPIMDAEIRVPGKFVGGVMGDLAKRRGKVQDMSYDVNEQVITATIPLSETFGYITKLRSLTQGQGTCCLQFSNYEIVPKEIQKQIENKWKQHKSCILNSQRFTTFVPKEDMITLNQEEIQLACKLFVKKQYGLETPSDDSNTGVMLRIVQNDYPPNTGRIEADVDVNDKSQHKTED